MIDAYRLAKFYKQSPDIFLAMPFSEVRTHLRRTVQLLEIEAQERRARDDPD